MFQKWERKEQIWSWRYVECVVVCFLFNFLYVAYIIVARSFSHFKAKPVFTGLGAANLMRYNFSLPIISPQGPELFL